LTPKRGGLYGAQNAKGLSRRKKGAVFGPPTREVRPRDIRADRNRQFSDAGGRPAVGDPLNRWTERRRALQHMWQSGTRISMMLSRWPDFPFFPAPKEGTVLTARHSIIGVPAWSGAGENGEWSSGLRPAASTTDGSAARPFSTASRDLVLARERLVKSSTSRRAAPPEDKPTSLFTDGPRRPPPPRPDIRHISLYKTTIIHPRVGSIPGARCTCPTEQRAGPSVLTKKTAP